MDARSFALIVTIALSGSALAGCIENPDWFTSNASEVSAFQNKAAADGAASVWSADAKLIGVMAFELSQSPDPRIDSDPDPGNGLAPAWWYVYSDASEAVRAFKVTSDGNVTSEKDAEAFAMGMERDSVSSIVGWSVDSDVALKAAKANETFAKVAQGFNASIVEGVAQHPDVSDAPAWWFSAMSVDGLVVATVSAVSGELIEVTTLDAPTMVPTFEWASNPGMQAEPVHLEGEGVAKKGSEPAIQAFSVEGPLHGILHVTMEAAMPSDGLHWAIVDVDGETVGEGHFSTWSGRSREYEVELSIEDAGEYTLTFFHMSSLGSFFPVDPVGGSVEYAYVLDLMPGGAEDVAPRAH